MTIMGVAADRERAVIWADTLISSPTGSRNGTKLAINAAAGVLGVSTGVVSVLRGGDEALLAGDSFETILSAVARELRNAATKLASRHPNLEPGWFVANLYVIAGFVPAEGRIVAYALHAADLFEPRQTSLAVWPPVPIPWCGCPQSLGPVRAAAAAQAGRLREHGGDVGWLTVATLTPYGITVLPPEEIAAAPTSTPEVAARSPDADAEAPAVQGLSGPSSPGQPERFHREESQLVH